MGAENFSRQARGWQTPSRWQNLPMVWSHCLGGAWLGGYWPGAERWDRLTILIVGANVCYAARISVEKRWCLRAPAAAAWEVAWPAIVYPLASALSSHPSFPAAIGEGVLVATYVYGSSVLARGEPAPGERPPRWAWLLVVLPVIVNSILSARFGPGHLIVLALPLFWLARVGLGRTVPLGLGRGAALRAGAVLVDLSAVVACAAFLPWLGWFAILFVLALACGRLAREM